MNESGLVENLVTQFSSALDCLRELVQNSIDAGSPAVEVWMEFEAGEGHQGVISLHVDDFGEGMDEQIIDNQLTRLFASTKEDDLTKIGKFGIGFVSVFALRPKGVLVETGRGGEYWQIFFHEDRSFTKTQIDSPVEGCAITIFLEGDFHRYRQLTEEVEQTLRHWCSHSGTEITFEDRSPADGSWGEPIRINEAFEVPGECAVQVTHQGTQMVMAYHHEPLYGFYNRGLTLAFSRHGEDVLFERARRYRHIAFKIKSRYLEHTLSRETIMRDANYEKAMRLLDEAAAGQLLGALTERMEELCALVSWDHSVVTAYIQCLGFLACEPVRGLEQISQRHVMRLVDGRSTTLERMLELWERDGRLLMSPVRSALTDALAAERVPVIFGRVPSSDGTADGLLDVAKIFRRFAAARLRRTVGEQARGVLRMIGIPTTDLDARLWEGLKAPEQVYMPVEIDEVIPKEVEGLVRGASSLLKRAEAGYRAMGTCRLVAPSERAPLFVVAPKLDRLMALPPTQSKRRRQLSVAVNRDHRQFKLLAKLWRTDPAMASYCLAKDLLLDQDRLLDRDMQLMSAALQA